MGQRSRDYFFYFAYGSNLFKKRILINNPSAIFVAVGQLNNHRFDFAKYNANWKGAVCTIVPTENEVVWGAVWKLHNDDLPALDRQEGVAIKEYFSKIVNIIANRTNLECRTYQHFFEPPLERNIRFTFEHLPEKRRPSVSYLNCLIKGAIECKLPSNYISKLKKIPHNGCFASPQIRKFLDI
ncbi:unnamed protein product [Arctia plantaginis]|uniref:gamma-glutamylcyclotransferase n=1 Tax=Arctia plantaginis TaxID=874455 RepID=A0A8S1B0L0_ARCPL|nr:unnamed protein product [Arctia plantaginis]CAB3254873.1 unnamed protein product [Arctia plantaginis]